MDPITAAIVGALIAGVLTGLTEIGKMATTDAYIKLKGLLNKKFGATSGVMSAITQLEHKPESTHRQGVLQEEIAAVNAGQDAEVLAAAKHLQTLVQQQQISLHRATVYGSINQVGHNQYQIGRDQFNVHGSELVGPDTRRSVRRVISVLLIIGGLISSISAAAVLPFFDALVNSMNQSASSSPNGTSFTDATNSFGTAVHITIYLSVALGIVMVIGGIWMSFTLRKP